MNALKNSLTMFCFLSPFHTHNKSSLWGGGGIFITIWFHFPHVMSLTIDQHVSSKLHFVAPWFKILLYFGMIHNMKERLTNVHWWFIISNACMLSNIMYCRKNTSNVVNTRTKICIFMVVTQEPTMRKMMPLTHFKSLNDFIKKPKVPKNNHARLHEDIQLDQLGRGFSSSLLLKNIIMQNQNCKETFLCKVAWVHATSSVGGYIESQNCHIFILFSFHHSSHSITSFSHSLYYFHEYIWVSAYYFPLYSF